MTSSWMLVAGFLFATTVVLREPDLRVVCWFGLVASVICAGWQLGTSTFHPVRWDNAWTLVGVAVCGTLAQSACSRSSGSAWRSSS
jgi:hypothetical protein